MNYRHGYHAGNFADVVKHVALVSILIHLKKKQSPFAVIDTHAGRGLYDLSGEEARKTDEASGGIERLGGICGSLPDALAQYLRLVESAGAKRYPGSPLLAARLLRPQDRLVAIEKHADEAVILKQTLAPWRKAIVEVADGYARLVKLMPPPERRGIVLIDPPFEAVDEFKRLAVAVCGAYRRFANGIFLIWYPIKSQSAADAFLGEVQVASAGRALTIVTEVVAPEGRLARAGLLVLNPPFGFDLQMKAVLAVIGPALAAQTQLSWREGVR
jgi:23S rRNA (adenine2030-N6)-methyltransferase